MLFSIHSDNDMKKPANFWHFIYKVVALTITYLVKKINKIFAENAPLIAMRHSLSNAP